MDDFEDPEEAEERDDFNELDNFEDSDEVEELDDVDELDDDSFSGDDYEDDFPEEDSLDEEDYQEQGYVTDRYEDLDAWRENPPDEAYAENIEAKLLPQGETEKLGVVSPGYVPKHKRKMEYKVPVAGLLKEYPDNGFSEVDDYTRRQARALEETLSEFKIEASVVGISRGPVITMFEIQPSPGVKVSRIVGLQDNLALRLAASRIRIVAPIPGKQAIGIEVPNRKRSIVSYSELVSSDEFKDTDYEIPVILGKDISGGNQVIDLTKTPHLLIAGSTGSGKSVCVNSLICSILYQRSPREVKLIMVDPKIVELKLYNDIPHLLTPVITESKKAFQAVQWCLYEMERRYALLDAMGTRDIKSYNKRIKERDIATTHLPYIVLVIDEFADLMATSGKELEGIVARLAAMSRAVGIHLVLATQRPSIDVITGLIKANFPSRIAFMVASKTDSRIIIDMMGAEKLLGRGDMLFTSAWDPFPSRVQGAFLSEDEVERVVSYVKTLGEPEYIDDEIFLDDDDYESGGSDGGPSSFSDPLYEKALDIVISAGKASASYLQRRLQIGYNRAARLVEEMEIQGIVGPQNGSKPREVVHIPDRPGREMLNTEGD
jgi:S-DNA-T family DNA segregation ATPase FtsK/SpoIIIE